MNKCSCVFVDNTEVVTCLEQKIKKANRKYICVECGCIIEKGDKYEYYRSIYCNIFDTYKTCLDCLSVRKEFFCEGFEFYSMWDLVHEHIYGLDGEISSDCIVNLTKKARDKICDIIDGYWEDYYDEEE